MGSSVFIAVMPFLPLNRPALGPSLLKAGLAAHGFACDVRYFSLLFADHIGIPAYHEIADEMPTHDLVGDWIFTLALYGEDARATGDFASRLLGGNVPSYNAKQLALIAQSRNTAPLFIQTCADEICQASYSIVGFSTTFQQNIASLALARELKRRDPTIWIVFGGANCEGEMGEELHRRFGFIDVVCSGEADRLFPELVSRLVGGHQLEGLPGVIYRQQGETVISAAPQSIMVNLNDLPYPDHSDFLRDFASSSAQSSITPEMTMETSRGCWWGQKHHCTFCGLNGTGMSYRSKSPTRAFDEINYLVDTYHISSIFNTDNIVDIRYFSELFPRLYAHGLKLELYYETKSNLKKSQLANLRKLGTTWFQPGIESLNTHVLTLMRKGVRGIHNIQVIKWAKELGFRVTWNILCGFPGEKPEDYEQTASVIKSISHLQPPAAISRFRLDRFSPMFAEWEKYGLTGGAPVPGI